MKEAEQARDKKIPFTVMIIGTFEISVALLGLMLLILVGSFDANSLSLFVLLAIYATIGAGLWAIREWARAANVALHLLAIPYVVYTTVFLGGPGGWKAVSQVLIAAAIVIALSRPGIRRKFAAGARGRNGPN